MVQDNMELCNSGSQVLHHQFDFGRFKTERMDVTLPVQVLSFGEPAYTKKEVSPFGREENSHSIDNAHDTGKLLAGI